MNEGLEFGGEKKAHDVLISSVQRIPSPPKRSFIFVPLAIRRKPPCHDSEEEEEEGWGRKDDELAEPEGRILVSLTVLRRGIKREWRKTGVDSRP